MLGCTIGAQRTTFQNLYSPCMVGPVWGWNSDHLFCAANALICGTVSLIPRSLLQLLYLTSLIPNTLGLMSKTQPKQCGSFQEQCINQSLQNILLKSKYEFVSEGITTFWFLDLICKRALQTKGTGLKEYILWYSGGSWSPHRTDKTAPPPLGGLWEAATAGSVEETHSA